MVSKTMFVVSSVLIGALIALGIGETMMRRRRMAREPR
jgi:hypothetical protein